jgi:rhodanese-related sulfurtransferase
MPATNAITPEKLYRLLGLANSPNILDLRDEPARLIPGAIPSPAGIPPAWAAGRCVLVCEDGRGASPGAAAWLRASGRSAELLDGGFAAWTATGLPTVDAAKLPPRDSEGRTRWVTRARPKVDRIACPWLIRRFVDPGAIFLFVAASELETVAARYDAAVFDAEGVFWSHRGDLCTFDTMLAELGLDGVEALARLAPIVRGADTARPELAPQAAGLLAASLGLSRLYSDDHEQLEAGLALYDAFYRWGRDAVDETHDWVSHAPRKRRP